MSYLYDSSCFDYIDLDSLLIVFDTNALLNLYPISEETLEHLIEKFEDNAHYFWVP